MQVKEEQALFEAIDAYKNGNGEKAAYIYNATKKYAYSIIYQQVSRFKNQGVLTGDTNAFAEDVMQELYLNFFSNIAKFKNENEKSIYKWMSVVSYRTILDCVDKNKMEVLQFAKDEDYREENDIWDSAEVNDGDLEGDHEMLPEAALEDKEFRQLILDFINELPDAQAQTILLHFQGGMKYQEIADEMGVSLITVKTRMKKAKDSLEEIITKYEKKTGTKLHSVSILPLLWLLYRMAAEDTVVPVAVDTAVTSAVVTSTGVVTTGITTATTVGTAAATKIIGVKTLIAIVSATVVIGGGVYVGSQLLDRKEPATEEMQQDEMKQEQEETGNPNTGEIDGSKEEENTNEEDTSQIEDDESGSNSNEETQNGADVGNEEASTEGAVEDENSNSEDSETSSEAIVTKGTKENPYKIGEKIIVADDVNLTSVWGSGDIYHFELTVTEYTPFAEATKADGLLYNIVQATVKITGQGEDLGTNKILGLAIQSTDGKKHRNFNGDGLYHVDGKAIDVKLNTEYTIGVHVKSALVTNDVVEEFLQITYYTTDEKKHEIYVKLE